MRMSWWFDSAINGTLCDKNIDEAQGHTHTMGKGNKWAERHLPTYLPTYLPNLITKERNQEKRGVCDWIQEAS